MVLVVEDESPVRALTCRALAREGYRVLEAVTPEHACELFERHSAEIALLLSDIVMPNISGPTLAQRFVAVQPNLRVLFMSGYEPSNVMKACAPHVSFLSKPFGVAALLRKVAESFVGPAVMRYAS